MPRHPPIALKTLDRSHCQCPSGSRPHGMAFEKTSFSRSVRWLRLGMPIRCRGLSVHGDGPCPSSPGRLREVMGLPGPGSEHGTRTNLLFTMSYRTGRGPKSAANFCFSVNDWRSPSRPWWSRTGSNRRHPACKAGALPAELRPLQGLGRWWAWIDSNYRPHPYQGCALTT